MMKVWLFDNVKVAIIPQTEWCYSYFKVFKSFKSVRGKGIYFYNKRTKEYLCYDCGKSSNQEFETDDFYVKGVFMDERVLEKAKAFLDRGLFSFIFLCCYDGVFLDELKVSGLCLGFLREVDDWRGVKRLEVVYDLSDFYRKECSIVFEGNYDESFKKDFLDFILYRVGNKYVGGIRYVRGWYGDNGWYTITFYSFPQYKKVVDVKFDSSQADGVLNFLRSHKERTLNSFLRALWLFNKVKVE